MSRGALVLACALLVAAPDDAGADPRQARARAKQARAYFEAGDYGRAAQEYEAAYRLDRRPSRIYNLAVCHDRAGDRGRALELYRRYLALEPTGEAAQVASEAVASIETQLAEEARLAAAALRKEQLEAAEAEKRAEAAKDARERDEHAAELAAAGLHAAAAAELALAYDLDPAAPARLWRSAEAYRQAGDWARAGAEYRRYLTAAPNGPHELTARLWLQLVSLPAVAPVEAAAPSGGAVASGAKRPRRRQLAWLVLAGAAILSGVALDLLPDSANNGSFDEADLAPIGCYALGALFIGVWTF